MPPRDPNPRPIFGLLYAAENWRCQDAIGFGIGIFTRNFWPLTPSAQSSAFKNSYPRLRQHAISCRMSSACVRLANLGKNLITDRGTQQ
jgi:hypothetical protein